MHHLSHQIHCNSHSCNSYPSSNLRPTFLTKDHTSNPVVTKGFLHALKQVTSLFCISFLPEYGHS